MIEQLEQRILQRQEKTAKIIEKQKEELNE